MATSLTHGKVVGVNPQTVVLAGRAVFGASGAVASANTPGFVFADSGTTGVYTVTPDEKYGALLAITATIFNNSVETYNAAWQIEAQYTSGAVSLGYLNDVGGTEAYADPPSGAGVHIIAVFQRGVARPSST
jgi:hypothetical protein